MKLFLTFITNIDAAAYTGWTLGRCEGLCGIGKRSETRKCARGDCNEELSRIVDCNLPKCTDAQQCESLNLKCSENAKCEQSSVDSSFNCKCLPGFAGDGIKCSFANNLKSSINLILLSFMVIKDYFL